MRESTVALNRDFDREGGLKAGYFKRPPLAGAALRRSLFVVVMEMKERVSAFLFLLFFPLLPIISFPLYC